MAANFPRAHVRVGEQPPLSGESPALPLACGLDPGPDHLAGLFRPFPDQLTRLHRGHTELDVDPVQQRPRHPGEVAVDRRRLTAAGPGGVAVVPAGASPRCLSAMCICMHHDPRTSDARKSLSRLEMHYSRRDSNLE